MAAAGQPVPGGSASDRGAGASVALCAFDSLLSCYAVSNGDGRVRLFDVGASVARASRRRPMRSLSARSLPLACVRVLARPFLRPRGALASPPAPPLSRWLTAAVAASGRLLQQLGHAPAALAVTASDAPGEQQASGCSALLWLPPPAPKVRVRPTLRPSRRNPWEKSRAARGPPWQCRVNAALVIPR